MKFSSVKGNSVALIQLRLNIDFSDSSCNLLISVKEKLKEKDPEMVDNINKLKNQILYNNKENEI